MLPSSRSPVSLSSSVATLLLFLFVSLPLLVATRAPPDQYSTATAHHRGHQPELRPIKLQSSETLQPLQNLNEHQQQQLHTIKSEYIPSVPLHQQQQSPHSIKLEHSSPLQTPQQHDDKLSSDHNKKEARNIRSADDASQIHRVKLAKSDYKTGSLLALQVSALAQRKEKNDEFVDATKNKTIHYEGDDDITIDQVKALDESLQDADQLEELDINIEDNNLDLLSSNIRRAKRESPEETVRQKRDYIRWFGTSNYQPQTTYISSYQLHARVPYFIPIWGNPVRIPVYFPIKPILYNPGYPAANRPNIQPTQRPDFPIDGTTEIPQTTANVSIGNRINVDDNPVWGIVETEPNLVGPSNTVGGRPNTQPRKPATPPLIHRPSRTDADDNNIESNPPSITQIPNDLSPTSRPFPQIPNNNRDPLFDFVNGQAPIPTTRRPPPPPPVNNQGNRVQEPSRCVWAVISCCSPLSTNVRYSCFEQLGCNGSFWDGNPCSREYTTAALNAAQKFYEQMGTRR